MLKGITIKHEKRNRFYGQIFDYDIYINDGTETSIINKGDGIKSLVTLAMLKERKHKNIGASIIAIEEPESYEVAELVASCDNLDEILIPQKSGFIDGLITSIKMMMQDESL